MTDFETLLAARLTDLVDHDAGTPHAAPLFVPTDEADDDGGQNSSLTRWVLAAAALLVVAGLTWATISIVAPRSGPAIAGPSGTAIPSTPAATSSAPTSPSATTSSPASSPVTVVLNGMKLVVPQGWAVGAQQSSGTLADLTWCLDPTPASGRCTILLQSAGVAQRNALDPDIEGGWLSNPSYCNAERTANPAGTKDSLDLADVRAFGGREAEHRVWTHTCNTTKVIHVEQYEVVSAPSWILTSDYADSTVSAVMAQIAQTSALPAQTLPVRLADKGYVRSVTKNASGYVITLDRIYSDPTSPSGEINKAATTYTYTVPSAALSSQGGAGAPPIVGDKVYLASDGTTVTSYSVIR